MNKTSEEWQKQFPNTKVIDPDGWDRQNFQYSWFEEKITLIEYTSRLHRSTVKGIIPKEEPKQETLEEAVSEFKKTDVYINEIKQQQEQQMYSEEEVLKLLRQYALEEHLITSSKPDIWFEQFKKK